MKVVLSWRHTVSEIDSGISYEIKPLSVGAFQTLMAFYALSETRRLKSDKQYRDIKGTLAGKTELKALKAVQDTEAMVNQLEMVDVAESVFAEHVRNLKGIEFEKDGVKTIPTPMELCGVLECSALVAEIIGHLTRISSLQNGDQGNSKGPQVQPTPEPVESAMKPLTGSPVVAG